MGIVFTQGLNLQGDRLFAQWFPSGTDTLGAGVLPDSVTFSDTTTYGDVSQFLGTNGSVGCDPPFFQSIALGISDATATLAPVNFDLRSGAGSVTIGGWLLYSLSDSVLLWGGDVSPAVTLSPSGPTSGELEGITITYGQCSPLPPSPPALFAASFNAPNGTSLSAYIPDIGAAGTTFDNGGGHTFTIEAATAQITGSGGFNGGVLWAAGASDYTYSGYITLTPTTEDGALIIRATDGANFWEVDVDGTLLASTIYECVAGVFTPRASVALSRHGPGTHHVSIVCNGPSITAVIDGSDSVSYGSATFQQNATNIGILCGGEITAATVQFNGLLVV